MLDQGNGVRVLGSSQPTRSIGGSTYKLPIKAAERSVQLISVLLPMCLDQSDLCSMERVLGAKRQATDRPIRTPPYKTADPDVIARALHPANGDQLKFLILATDGCKSSLSIDGQTDVSG